MSGTEVRELCSGSCFQPTRLEYVQVYTVWTYGGILRASWLVAVHETNDEPEEEGAQALQTHSSDFN